MTETVFPYPGGKSRYVNWILQHVPSHECYVEVFGGSGAVLVNKEPSPVEIYNDRDEDLVHFFEILREQPDDLVAWLDAVPYSREVHERWAERYYNGYRPADAVARAGQFFFLRYSQFGACYDSQKGFAYSKTRSQASGFANKIERLHDFAERFAEVTIECLDWRDVLDRYDGPDTVFYLDPPYVGKEHYYPVEPVGHSALVEALDGLEARWVCSYEDLPDGLADHHVVSRDGSFTINAGRGGTSKDATERLVMNFDPTDASVRRTAAQQSLSDATEESA